MKKLLFIALAIWGCSSTEQSQQQAQQPVKPDSLAHAQPESKYVFDIEKNFYTHYEGLIDGKYAISADIIKIGPQLRGYYTYDRKGMPIAIRDGKIAKDGSFKATEYDLLYNATGRIDAQIKEHSIEGTWISGDSSKRLPIVLKAVQRDGVFIGEVFHEEKVVPYDEKKKDSPTYTFIYSVLYPSAKADQPAKEVLFENFDKNFGKMVAKGNPWQSISNIYEASLKEYKENVKDMAGVEGLGQELSWSEVMHADVVYNSQHVLSVSWDYYSYTGGAHGNYGRTLTVIDLRTGNPVKLADVFSKGFEQPIAKIIEDDIRKQDGIKPGEALADYGYFEEVTATDNFYLTNKGIGFYYSPYEIAPYARGGVEVFIPYKDCAKYISPKGPAAQFLPNQ